MPNNPNTDKRLVIALKQLQLAEIAIEGVAKDPLLPLEVRERMRKVQRDMNKLGNAK